MSEDVYDVMVAHAHALASMVLAENGVELNEHEADVLDTGIKAGVTGALSEIRDRGWKIEMR